MARSYQKKPSEIVNIENDYVAYCFDEAAYSIENHVLNDKGQYKWNRIKWVTGNDETKSNQDLIDFINKQT